MDDTQAQPEVSPEVDKMIETTEWKDFNADPTPFVQFSKELQLPDGPMVLIRLPNPFQHRKVQEHAQAARARRVLAHKNPDSDVSVIIAERVTQVEDLGEEGIRQWLLEQHSAEALFAAKIRLDYEEESDGEGNKRLVWPSMPEHQDRYRILIERDETETDEFKELELLLTRYAKALEEAANMELEPHRALYDALDYEGLLEKAKRALIKSDCLDEFTNAYNLWQIFYGTRKHDATNASYYHDINDLIDEKSEIVELLVNEFSQLDALKAVELGKSQRAISLLASLASSEI